MHHGHDKHGELQEATWRSLLACLTAAQVASCCASVWSNTLMLAWTMRDRQQPTAIQRAGAAPLCCSAEANRRATCAWACLTACVASAAQALQEQHLHDARLIQRTIVTREILLQAALVSNCRKFQKLPSSCPESRSAAHPFAFSAQVHWWLASYAVARSRMEQSAVQTSRPALYTQHDQRQEHTHAAQTYVQGPAEGYSRLLVSMYEVAAVHRGHPGRCCCAADGVLHHARMRTVNANTVMLDE